MDVSGTDLRVLYDFEYETKDKRKICITKGEKLFLINKTNDDWWQVIKNSSERPFFVPAPYVSEAHETKQLTSEECHHRRLSESKDNDCENLFDQIKAKDTLNYEGERKQTGDTSCVSSSCRQCGNDICNLHSVDFKYFPGRKHELKSSSCAEVKYSECDETSAGGSHDVDVFCDKCDLPSSSDNACVFPDRERENTWEQNWTFDSEKTGVSNECGKHNMQLHNLSRIKGKLSHSRSFKTKNELQMLSSVRREPSVPYVNVGMADKRSSCAASLPDRQSCNENCTKEKGWVLESDTPDSKDPHSFPVALAFHNELYDFNDSHDTEATKTHDSGNISSESLYNLEEDISDSGASHKSDRVSSAQSKESIQEHSDLVPYDDTSKDDNVTSSSTEDIWNIDSYEDVPIPPGWSLSFDEESGEQCYINEATEAKWFSSTDGEGRVYFFEENSSESSWTLPNIVVSKDEARASGGNSSAESSLLNLRNSDGDKKMRTRARSMFLSDQKYKENTGKSSSIPRDWLQRYGLDKDVVKYGNMNRTKITENGKKMGKKWASAYVVLTNDTLCFYKDHKSPQQSTGLQPEMSMQLSGARVEPGEKLSSRKHVFLVTSSTLQLLCECDSAEAAAQWQEAISKAIFQLNKPPQTESIKLTLDKPKVTTIGRSKSMQVKSRDVEDQSASSEEQQTKIRDRLKKFFHRRPTRETLASKGIYKDEPVFDSHLKKVCPTKPPYIPEFVRRCIAAIESKEDNMKTDGLYRASGNLSHVQKIRLRVDQNDLSVLAAEEDVHVLTGALKLFFRELKEPLIPYELFNKAISAGGMTGDRKDKIKVFREIVKQLPPPNHDTLKFLLKHLKRVTDYEVYNRMQIPNIAIVFGPTLMWREMENHQIMAIEYMQQNLVIEFLLQQFDDIF